MSLPFRASNLTAAIDNGRVTQRKHPTLPLWIYNYSAEVQYDNSWDDVTLNCRGLILDDNWNIVARPWKKFFNLGQVNLPIQFDDPVEVTEKMDGSLGILYSTGNSYAISTRGSFESTQAIHATKILLSKYRDWVEQNGPYQSTGITHVISNYTLLFEIIFPENRIVLNYDGLDDLVLLGMVEKTTGYYYGPKEAYACTQWPGPVVETFKFNTLSGCLQNMSRKGKEGFVARSNNFLVKIKEPDYLELHRLVTNITPKNIWLQLSDGMSVSEITARYPDEFHDYVKSIAEPMVVNYNYRLNTILADYAAACANYAKVEGWDTPINRKKFANLVKDDPNKFYYFLLLDNRVIRDTIWKYLQPKEKLT